MQYGLKLPNVVSHPFTKFNVTFGMQYISRLWKSAVYTSPDAWEHPWLLQLANDSIPAFLWCWCMMNSCTIRHMVLTGIAQEGVSPCSALATRVIAVSVLFTPSSRRSRRSYWGALGGGYLSVSSTYTMDIDETIPYQLCWLSGSEFVLVLVEHIQGLNGIVFPTWGFEDW